MAKIKFNLVKLEKEVILQVIEQDRKERINGRLAGKIVEVNNTKYCFIFGGHSYPEIRTNNKKFFSFGGRLEHSGNVIFLGGADTLPKKANAYFNSNSERDKFYDEFLEGLSKSYEIEFIGIFT